MGYGEPSVTRPLKLSTDLDAARLWVMGIAERLVQVERKRSSMHSRMDSQQMET